MNLKGIELTVTLTDHNEYDSEGNPKRYHNTRMITNYELAKMDGVEFAEQAIEISARDVIHVFRNEE